MEAKSARRLEARCPQLQARRASPTHPTSTGHTQTRSAIKTNKIALQLPNPKQKNKTMTIRMQLNATITKM
eukprot:6462150-Amphidinium_carterae.1